MFLKLTDASFFGTFWLVVVFCVRVLCFVARVLGPVKNKNAREILTNVCLINVHVVFWHRATTPVPIVIFPYKSCDAGYFETQA